MLQDNADIVIVESGTYNENVNVNKQLTLRGNEMPVVDAMGSGSAITLSADGITLEGFSATGSEFQQAGIEVTSSNNMLIGNIAFNNYNGILLEYSGNNTLTSNTASNNQDHGISLSTSSNNTLIGNNAFSNNGWFWTNGYGIHLFSSSNNNTLIGNNVSSNDYGISLSFSSKNMLKNNTMQGNSHNFELGGSSDLDFNNQIDTSNLVDEKPIYYIKGVRNTVYDEYTNAGTFYCIGCVNVTITNLDLKNNGNGIFFWNTTHSRIQNINASNNAYGISLSSSDNNVLIGNDANLNSVNWRVGYGINLDSSNNNTLISNNANMNAGYSISMLSSNNNTLIANNASENSGWGDGYRPGAGIWMDSSSNNNLIGNNASFNGNGIRLSSSNNNTLSGNIASNNKGYEGYYGISLFSSSNNRIFHNNLIQNTNQANDNSNNNSWDNGYPSGGNYWSDYTGVDLNSGPTQNIPGSDGIGDTPYNIGGGGGAQDRYPLNEWIQTPTTGPVHNINKGTNYTTIQAAIDASSPGDEIQVDSGTYYENVNVNKQLTLRGIGMPVVIPNYDGSAITLSADGITLEGFSATGAGPTNEAGIKVKSNNNRLINNNAYSNSWFDTKFGIRLDSSSNNELIGNNVSNNNVGIELYFSNNNRLTGNNASNNYQDANGGGGLGISLSSSSNNTLTGNIMLNNGHNFGVTGSIDSHYNNSIDISNTVNGKPIYYFQSVSDKIYTTYANVGTFYCINCNNITVRDSIFTNNVNGVFFWKTNNSKIEDVDTSGNYYGIHLSFSSNNKLNGNKASNNGYTGGYGIYLDSSSNNELIGNNASNNIRYHSGICPNGFGITLSSSSNNTLSGNTASNNGGGCGGSGISLDFSSKNTLIGNNVSNNGELGNGISLSSSSNNKIFHNNLIQNFIQADDNSNNNSWDNGYPSGGNYWSDYTGVDLNSGPSQNIPGSDGIGDTPYSIIGGAGAQDRYPFMEMITHESTKTVELEAGWNLISIPLNLNTWILGDESTVGNPLNVTPTNCLSSIYRYNTTSYLFEKSDHFDNWGWYPATGSGSFTALEPGRGYWVMAQQDCELTFTGTEPSDLDIPLDTGWNLIGWYSMNEAALGEEAVVGNPLNVTPANSLTSIYRYNTTSALFEKSDHFPDWGWYPATGSEGFTKMEPGRGYWLMANNDAFWRHNSW